ncbi:glycosyltransferase family 4 protein [Mesobacillus zeae]|uniref:Glycosyltransferase n=1 Tax=Mesobacillus zeae TaxID=1917180 RepID=A0A398B5S1_9BACI|nr:glycosyltransferase family 4 protein [Mesobacillus zeae]RID84168.1 glycosyltransferase [Mesobacillus zeae]
MRIVMLADHLVFGGLETHIVTIINGLTELGHEVLLYVASCSSSILSQISPDNFTFLSWSEDSIEEIKRFNPDIVHSHPFTAIIKGKEIAAMLQKPLVVTMHGLYDFGFDDSPLGNEISQSVKRIIAVDYRVALHLLNNVVEPEKISIIRNGINFDIFHPRKKDKHLMKELGLNRDGFTISLISRFDDEKEKPIIQFLRCIPELSKSSGNLNILIVGDGGKLKEVQNAFPKRIRQGVQIKLIGWEEKIEDIYNISDLVFGSGRVALEALSCKAPVYAMWEGFGELIGNNNHDAVMMGSTFKQVHDFELLSSVAKLIKNPKVLNQAAQEGFEVVRRHYDCKVVVNQLVRIYEQYSKVNNHPNESN